jgi:hypothetical protein
MDTLHTLRPLPPVTSLLRHVARNAGQAAVIICFALGVGSVGYHYFEHLSWLDAELNAAMILTGMGPVDHIQTVGGKIFASAYALFAGLAFLSTAALVFAPLAKRALHGLHLDMHAPPLKAHSTDTSATAA